MDSNLLPDINFQIGVIDSFPFFNRGEERESLKKYNDLLQKAQQELHATFSQHADNSHFNENCIPLYMEMTARQHPLVQQRLDEVVSQKPFETSFEELECLQNEIKILNAISHHLSGKIIDTTALDELIIRKAELELIYLTSMLSTSIQILGDGSIPEIKERLMALASRKDSLASYSTSDDWKIEITALTNVLRVEIESKPFNESFYKDCCALVELIGEICPFEQTESYKEAIRSLKDVQKITHVKPEEVIDDQLLEKIKENGRNAIQAFSAKQAAAESSRLSAEKVQPQPATPSLTSIPSVAEVLQPKDPLIALYGAKMAGLIHLQRAVQKVKTKHSLLAVKIDIPPFAGLENPLMRELLNQKIGSKTGKDLESHWAEFQTVWLANPTVAEGSPAMVKLNTVKKLVQTAIEEMDDSEILTLLGEDRERIAKMGTIMVRSSSEEDGDTPNAGGNESLGALGNSASSIRHALGEVLASYFSEKSIGQRFTGSQKSIQSIATLPNCAVLLQQFVGGEKEGKPSVAGGVIYSQHLIGDQSSPVAQVVIKAALGHASYVMDSKGPCSEYTIDDIGAVHAVERVQNAYITPVLDSNTNKVNLIQKPLEGNSANFSNAVLDALSTLARELEDNEGHVVDVEFIYDPAKNAVSLVQSRDPRGKKDQTTEVEAAKTAPERIDGSKLANKGTEGQSRILFSNPINVGQGHLFKVLTQKINAETQVFFTDELASNKLTGMAAKDRPPFVIVREGTKESHGSNTLEKMGITVVQADEQSFNQLQSLIKAGCGCLSLDPVTGTMVLAKELEELKACTVPGYGGYPAPCAESIKEPSKKMLDYLLTKDGINPKTRSEQILSALSEARQEAVSTYHFNNFSTNELLQELKDAEPERAIAALAILSNRFWPHGTEKYADSHADKLLLYSICRLYETLKAENSASDRLTRLYHIYGIERIWKQKSNKAISGSYDFKKALHLRTQLKTKATADLPHSQQLEELEEFKEIFLAWADRIPIPKQRSEFLRFINTHYEGLKRGFDQGSLDEDARAQIKAMEKNWQNLAKVAHKLENDPDLFYAWLNLFLSTRVSAKVDQFLKDLDSLNPELSRIVSKWETQFSEWEDPSKIDQLSDDFLEDFRKLDITQLFSQLKGRNEKNYLLATKLSKLIVIYDKVLKTVSASQSKDEAKKIQQFKKLVMPFAQASLECVKGYGLHNLPFRMIDSKATLSQDPAQLYVDSIQNLINSDTIPKNPLLPSADFNVAISSIGVGGTATPPVSYEDLFTLSHQNFEALIARSLAQVIDTTKLPYDNLIQQILNFKISTANIKPFITAVNFTASGVETIINLPCNNHAMQFILLYNNKTGKTDLIARLVGEDGENRNYRWEAVRSFAQLAREIAAREAPQPKLGSKKISMPPIDKFYSKVSTKIVNISLKEIELQDLVIFEKILQDTISAISDYRPTQNWTNFIADDLFYDEYNIAGLLGLIKDNQFNLQMAKSLLNDPDYIPGSWLEFIIFAHMLLDHSNLKTIKIDSKEEAEAFISKMEPLFLNGQLELFSALPFSTVREDLKEKVWRILRCFDEHFRSLDLENARVSAFRHSCATMLRNTPYLLSVLNYFKKNPPALTLNFDSEDKLAAGLEIVFTQSVANGSYLDMEDAQFNKIIQTVFRVMDQPLSDDFLRRVNEIRAQYA